MAFYAGNNIWRDVVYQLEINDPVRGGTVNWRGDEPSSGHSNAPLIQLADRTTFLKEEVGKILIEIEDGVLSGVDSEDTESIEIVGDGSAANPLKANIRSSLSSIAWTRGNNTFTRNNLFRGLTEVEDPTTPRSAVNKRSLDRVVDSIGLGIDDHNLDPNAHPDLRNLIDDRFNAHNHNPDAHPELSDFITSEANRAEDARDSAINAASSAGGYASNSLFYSQNSERFANAASIAASASSGIWRPSLSALRNVTDQPPNTMGVVYASATPSINGWYVWNGSEWVKSALQPTQKSQFGEYNPIAIPVDNFDIITMNGVYRGIVPWVENGTQTVTVNHFQEGGNGRRYQLAFFGLGNKSMLIYYRYFQSSSNSWGDWRSIVDNASLDALKNDLYYLGQRSSYLVYLPEYKGVKNKQEIITSTVLKDFLLDIKILNATEGKIYKIESIGFDPTSDPRYTHNLTIRIMSTDKDILDFVRMATYRVKVDRNKGIQTFRVKDSNSRAIEFTIDASYLRSNSNSFYSFENPEGYRYTWYINPKNYVYNTDSLSYNQIPSNNVSVNEIAQTYSNKFYTDPGENLLRGLNSPYRFHENGLVRSNIPARATFIFPKFDSSQGGMQVHETYPNVTRLNISSIDTATIAGNLTTQLFVSDWVSAYGIRRFRLLNPEPIHANVHGFLEFLIRVPDETTREVYTASIYTLGAAPAAMIEKQQHIGESSPLGRDEPRTLDASSIVGDSIYIQDTTPEIIEEWLSGYWQKVYIPLSGVVSFYNNRYYTFSIYRRNVSGTPTTDDTIRNTDLIILNGSFSFYYDASPKINHRYHHHLELGK